MKDIGNIMTDKELDQFIEENGKRGSIMGLQPIKALLEKMGNPEKKLKFIHIAGTNGKGSILAYTSNILTKAGYKTGRYLSPVISEYREKIQINGKFITKKGLKEGFSLIRDIVENMQDKPTLFEMETALAFWYFEKNACDIVVLETGLGGALDATNVIEAPLVAAFASISMDHMAYLGDSLDKIATVKAGIIKTGSSVVSANQNPVVAAVIDDVCRKLGTEPVYISEPMNVKSKLGKQVFDSDRFKKLEISLNGSFQPVNACVAVKVVELLAEKGFGISEKAVRQGLLDTEWPGRFTVLSRKPLIIMDGAHNEGAALELRKSVDIYLEDKPLVYVMGVLKDKDYQGILKIMGDRPAAVVTLTPPDNPRALPAVELAKEATKYCKNVTSADSVEEAIEVAKILAADKCAILCFGSLSYLGRLKKVVEKS